MAGLSLDSIVKVTIDRKTKFPTRIGFGIPAILDLTAVIAVPTTFTSVAEMLDAGFLAADQAVLAATAITSQNPRVDQFLVIPREANVAQVDTILIGGADDGTYTITINGVDFSFAASGSTETLIRDALITAINGGGEPVTAAPVSSDTLTITADVAGVGFSNVLSSNPNTNMVLTNTTLNKSPVTELIASQDILDTWYLLLTTDRTKLTIGQLEDFIETQIRVFIYETDEPDSKDLTDTADSTSILKTTKTKNLDRTAGIWTKTSNLPNYPGASWASKVLPRDPGSVNWKFRNVAGVLPDDELTTQEVSNILAKNGNIYTTVAGISIFAEGTVGSGEFIDIIRGTDFIQARIQEKVFGLFTQELKVNFDNGGIEQVKNQVDGVLRLAVDQNILRADPPPFVTGPLVADTDSADRAARLLKNIKFGGSYAGAINKTELDGTLIV